MSFSPVSQCWRHKLKWRLDFPDLTKSWSPLPKVLLRARASCTFMSSFLLSELIEIQMVYQLVYAFAASHSPTTFGFELLDWIYLSYSSKFIEDYGTYQIKLLQSISVVYLYFSMSWHVLVSIGWSKLGNVKLAVSHHCLRWYTYMNHT